ncbi:hypothetical protein KAR91_55270 [Candidatus Pacearchaeota archaeon]|nr:hypothetical protein [Candidatus Pacearchaeota archaeon]
MLETGTYLDCDVKTYRAWPAINYSSLADFFESWDHALMVKAAKSYFEFGTAFELLVEDQAKGSNKFGERFFTCDAPGDMPDDLAGWIEKEEDLDTKYRLKKDGERHAGAARKHEWLDACQDNPGIMPKGKDEMAQLKKMVDNFMKMQPFADKLSRDQGVYSESPLSEILPIADFQVPIIWHVGKLMKKALIDCMVETESTIYVFDIKTAAELKRFIRMLMDRYWIQELHYTAGLKFIFRDKEIVWRFLVSSKAEPYLSQPFCVDPMRLGDCSGHYNDLCTEYQAWTEDGRPPKGWKPLEKVGIYFN